MATTKSYTDLEQSRKLADILPVESADMFWKNAVSDEYIQCFTPFIINECGTNVIFEFDVPCWSLAALLSIIKPVNQNTYTLTGTLDGGAIISFEEVTNVMFQEEEIIDAVFEMICWLKENNKL